MSSYTKALTNAAKFFDLFANADFTAGKLSFGAAATTDVLTHGLSGTPDFVLVTRPGVTGTNAPLTWSADGTSVTFTRAGSTAAETYSYFVGVLAS